MKITDEIQSGNSTKAGLPETCDKINQIINDASKNSKFTIAANRRDQLLGLKIEALRAKFVQAQLCRSKVVEARRVVDLIVGECEKGLKKAISSKEHWVCIDMDAFFAAVETLDRPEFANIPMAVGSHSMLSTSNYEARKFGVVAAMPGYIAMKLCPQLTIVTPNFGRYKVKSEQVRDILKEYDKELTMFSLDEAILKLMDESDTSISDRVDAIRRRILVETGLSCSAGIGCNKALSKLGSNINKPNGQFQVPCDTLKQIKEFLADKPIRKINGIGKVTAKLLEKVLGVVTCYDLWNERYNLPLVFKEKTIEFLVACSIGHSFSSSYSEGSSYEQKSLSCERSFKPTNDQIFLHEIIAKLSSSLQEDMKNQNVNRYGKVGLKLKSDSFQVFTRECTTRDDLLTTAQNLLSSFMDEKLVERIRLVGVKVSKLDFVTDGTDSNSDSESEKSYKDDTRKRKFGVKNSIMDRWLKDTIAKCPICAKFVSCNDDLVNKHIDECLSLQLLRDEQINFK